MMNSTTVRSRIESPSGERLAHIHAVTHIWLQRLADVALQPMTVLAATLWLMNASYREIGAVVAIASAAAALGSMIMPFALQRATDVRTVLLVTGAIHALAAALMALLGWQADSFSPSEFVPLLIVASTFYFVSAAANIMRNPRSTLVNVDQPTTPLLRQSVGAVGAVLAGLVAVRTLGSNHLDFPRSIGMLIALGGIASIAAVWFQVTAPLRLDDTRRKPLVPSRRQLVETLSVGGMHRFLVVRVLTAISAIADPFIVIYGLSRMDLNLRMVGWIVLAIAIAQVLAGAFWTFFLEYRGTRGAVQIAALLRLLGLTLAASVPYVASTDWYHAHGRDQNVAMWLFIGVFGLLSVAHVTNVRNEQIYALRQLKNDHLFPASNFLLHLVVVIGALAPMVGALLLSGMTIQSLMLLAASLSFLALFATAFLQARRRLPRRGRLTPTPRGRVKRLPRATPQRRSW